MSGMKRAPQPGKGGGGGDSSTGTSSSSDTASGSSGPAAGGGGGGSAGNAAMADFVARHRHVIDDVMGLDSSEFLTFDVGAAREAIPLILGAAQKAAAGATENDFGAWQNALFEMEDAGEPFDGALTGSNDVYGHWTTLSLSDSIKADPDYAKLGGDFQGASKMRDDVLNALAGILQPTLLLGKFIPGLPKVAVNPFNGVEGVYKQVVDLYSPLFQAAFDVWAIGTNAKATDGYALDDQVLAIATGPLGSWPVGSPQFNYLWAAFVAGEPSAAVKVKLSEWMGITGTPASPMSDMQKWMSEWFAGRPDAAAIAGKDGAAAEGGKERGKDQALADMEGGLAKAPTPGGLDTSAVEGPAKPKDEEEAPATPATPAAASTTPAVPEEKEDETKYGASGKLVTSPGKVEGSLEGKREAQRGNNTSEAGVSLEGGATADHVYGTVGVDYTHKGRDSADEKASGMDVNTGAKFGTNEEGKVVADAKIGVTNIREDGSQTNVHKNIGYDGEGIAGGAGGSHTVDVGDGNKRTTAVDVTASTKGEVGMTASRQTKDEDGNVKSGIAGGGKVEFGEGKKGASGNVSYQKGAVNVVANASWEQTLQPPVEEDGRWVVEFEVASAAGGGFGGKTKKGGAGFDMGFEKHHGGKRYFKTQEEAKKFYEEGDVPSSPDNADQARQLQEGDTVTSSSGSHAGVHGEASYAGVSAGVGVNIGNEKFQNQTKGKGGLIRVEAGDRELAGWNASISYAGVGGGYGQSSSNMQSRTVEFDLDTSVGAAAYDYYLKNEQLPPSGRGWRIVGDAKGQSETTVKNLSILGLAYGSSHTVSHVDRNEDGHSFEEDQGTDSTNLSVPGMGSYSVSHSLWEQQVDNQHSLYQTESVVKASGLGDVQAGLRRGTGDYEASSGSNKGTYHIQTAIPEAKMTAFIQRVTQPGFEADAYATNWHMGDDARELRDALNAARGDEDAQRKALARWVADNGEDAVQFLYKMVNGDKNTDFYVAIDGDEYMKGMKGHLDQEMRIASWQQRIDGGEGGYGVANEIKKDLAYQEARRLALRNYGELPARILAAEYDRTDQHIANLTLLMNRALATVAEDEGAKSVAGTEAGQYQGALKLLLTSRGQFSESHRRVALARRIHLDGWGKSLGSGDSGKEEYDEDAAYKHADDLFSEANGIEMNARMWESGGTGSDLNERNTGMLASMLARAAFAYQSAARKLDECDAVYSAIADRHSRSNLMAGYQSGGRFVDGM